MVRSAGFEPAIPSLGSSYLNQAGLTSRRLKFSDLKIKAFAKNGHAGFDMEYAMNNCLAAGS